MRLWAPQLFSTLNIASSSQSPAIAQATTVCDLLTFVDPASAEELGAENYTCLPVNIEKKMSFCFEEPIMTLSHREQIAF